MFEVEKKFILSERQKARLLEGAEFLGEKIFTDAYYDNAQLSLGLNDIWLRRRGENFELKIPAGQGGDEMINKYHEIEGELAIREIFAIPTIGNFVEDLARLGHLAFCQFQTTRQKFFKDGFSIDLDLADYGDWQYQVAEIELMVDSKEEMENATEKIYAFAKKHGLKIAHVNGKLIEYLLQKRPLHYNALLEAGIVKKPK